MLSILVISQIAQAEVKTKILAPGYGALQFAAPLAGSYRLYEMGKAANGRVLTSDKQLLDLNSLMGDKIVLLSFIYATCSDVNGCPLATSVLHKIKSRLSNSPLLVDKIRLLTLSFNPLHDTPAVMKNYGKGFSTPGVEWHFLTTASEQMLQPLLEKYQQTVQKNYDEQGQFEGTFSHLLRVFLIDRDRQIRNIYSVAFLHADTLINDIKTLILESEQSGPLTEALPVRDKQNRYKAGDYKENYHQGSYATESVALTHRLGKAVDLMKFIEQPGLGLPKVPIPADNPVSRAKISLGRKLFYDRRLSLNNTFSCAMCHVPEQGFTSQEMATAVGVEGRTVRRNSISLYNVAYASKLFHDGRENTLEQQVWGPLLASNEMANPSIGFVLNKIKALPDYAGLFQAAFGRGVTMETLGMAIASYERTLNAGDSPFDRWFFGQQDSAINAQAKRGFSLFTGKAKCASCHTIAADFALFTDNKMHNTGLGYFASMHIEPARQQVAVAPGVFVNIDTSVIDSVSAKQANDLGEYEVSQNPVDRWKYKTPTLRNITLTAPYMHNGAVNTLEEVVRFYNQGGVAHQGLDVMIRPLALSETEVNDIIEFLHTLQSSRIEEIVSDAYAAPVGDPK